MARHSIVMRQKRLAAAIALALSAPLNAFALDLAPAPLFIPKALDPNLVVTLDDSGSMARAYAPDDIFVDSATRRFKSSTFNSLYFNPALAYPPPVDEAGNLRASCSDPSTPKRCMETTFINGFNPAKGTWNLLTSYCPTLNYVPSSETQSCAVHPTEASATDTTAVAAYYYQHNVDGTCTATEDDLCYTKKIVGVDLSGGETQDVQYTNFSNWYAFYRTRNLMTMTSASRAFSGLGDNIRIAWQGLNSCSALNDSCNNGIRKFTGTHRSNFFTWLSNLPASGSTPLRDAFHRAGSYYGTTGVNSPYAETPYVSQGTEYSCRPNFHIAMTDGMWNGTFTSTINEDEDSKTLPDGRSYDPNALLSRLFKSDSSPNVADIAFHFWANDLRTNLDNNLPPYSADKTGNAVAQYWNPRNDPATWQHMVNFTVGLGLGSYLGDNWTGSTYSGSFIDSVKNGNAQWPATGADDPDNVYDLWHAAINSRGQFFSADDPTSLTEAFKTALNRVGRHGSSAAALAANSTRLGTDTAVFQARFDSTDWSGDLFAIPLNPDGSTGVTAWNAASRIPAHDARKIFTWDKLAGGVTFTSAGLSTDQETSLLNGRDSTELENLINYIRGDRSNEGTDAYRKRTQRASITDADNSSTGPTTTSPLGDIINSDPAFVGSENFGYSRLRGEEWPIPSVEPTDPAALISPYDTFRATKESRPRMIYVGANDGMLHAFHASLKSKDSLAPGEEVFAYIPNAVIGNLAELSLPGYAHRYFVDSAPFAGDAYVDGGWKTLLVSSVGAGGKAVFALDVTNPASFDASSVHWEFTHDELGNSMGKPAIARLANGEWVAVFGNGPNSTSADPKLFMVALQKNEDLTWSLGNNYWVLSATKPTGYNELLDYGLSEPTLYDMNGDQIVDYVYAGDLQGNVWKFDVTSASSSYGAATLVFTARNASSQNQPITSTIEIGAPPSGKGGVMLYFGTGRFYAVGDNLATENAKTQTFYGIHDEFANNPSTFYRGSLVAQTITFEGDDPQSDHENNAIRLVSNNTINYSNKKGWLLDLTYGERVVSAPLLRYDRVIFTTLIPSDDPCDFGGTSWLMELSATTGGRLAYSVFDLNADKHFDAKDYSTKTPVSGVKSKVGIVKTPAVISGGEIEYKVMSGTTGGIQVVSEKGGAMTGRVSWREIFNK